MTFLEVVRR